jgi:hypothetical protein
MRNFVGVMVLAGMSFQAAGCASPSDLMVSSTSDQAPGRWACLGTEWPPPSEPLPRVTYATKVEDWVSASPPKDLTVCMCSYQDIPETTPGLRCSAPLPPTGCIMPNDTTPNVNVAVTLPSREVFTIEFLTPNTIPVAMSFNHMLTQDTMGVPAIRLLSFEVMQYIAQSFALIVNPILGSVLLRVYDCNGEPAPDVHFTLDDGANSSDLLSYAFRGGSPTYLRPSVTDATGQFGFQNVSPGAVMVRAFLADATESLEDDREIGSVTFMVLAGWINIVDMRL